LKFVANLEENANKNALIFMNTQFNAFSLFIALTLVCSTTTVVIQQQHPRDPAINQYLFNERHVKTQTNICVK